VHNHKYLKIYVILFLVKASIARFLQPSQILLIMFSKLTLHQALFLLSKFSKLSSTKIRERLLLFLDPKQVIYDVFKNNHNKYRSVFNLKSVTKTECFEALKLFGRQQQINKNL